MEHNVRGKVDVIDAIITWKIKKKNFHSCYDIIKLITRLIDVYIDEEIPAEAAHGVYYQW